MNRYLLAGCAAAALALGAGAANAQAKFEVKVGGDAYFEGGYVNEDRDEGARSVDFRNRFRVTVTPTAKADNGLEYGGRIRMRANSGANNARNMDADRGYIFAQGAFGQVQLGVTNSFNDATYVTAPQDYLPLAIYDGVTAWIGQTSDIGGGLAGLNGSMLSQSLVVENNATKIVYFSPRFAGLQVGASYTPRTDDSNNSVDRSEFANARTSASAVTNSFQDVVELGLNYNATFGAVSVKVGGGYQWGESSDVTGASFRDLNAWQAGAQVGFAGFTIGGSYTDWGKSGLNRALGGAFADSAQVWQAGAQYTVGPIVVGAGWMYGKDSGTFTAAGERDINVYEVGVSYTIAPGFAVQAQYDYFDNDGETAATQDKGSVVLLRTTLAF